MNRVIDIDNNAERLNFKEVYEGYVGDVQWRAFLYTRSQQEAEDISQDVFAKLWEHRNRIGQIKNIEGYIFRMTYNFCHNYSRRLALNRRHMTSAGQVDYYFHDSIVEKECNNIYQEAIKKLPEKQSRVLLLSEDFSRKEISTKLGIAKCTVDVHMAIAVKKVRTFVSYKLNGRRDEESVRYKQPKRAA